jgi:soluble P-type ATPase
MRQDIRKDKISKYSSSILMVGKTGNEALKASALRHCRIQYELSTSQLLLVTTVRIHKVSCARGAYVQIWHEAFRLRKVQV